MWEKLNKIWRIKSLRQSIFYVLGMLVIFRLVAHIPLPGVDREALRGFLAGNQILGLLNLFSGGTVENFSLIMLGIAIALSQLKETTSWLKFSYHGGIGYASQGWKASKLIKRVNFFAASRPVFTNAADAVYLLTGRPAYGIPAIVDPNTKLVNRNYASELAAMEVKLGQKSGILVYFSRVGWRRHLPSEDELLARLALQLIAREEDGSMYQLVEREKAGSAN